ncbi:MAG TPA: DinB family protein [Candidatus Limnocylindrales bacterium]|nr:DinB family protein [Candidatus Limnocylindrales bacterium]
MGELTIRPAYSMWPQYNRRLRDIVAAMTEEQLAIQQPGHGPGSSPERWPLWATVGHTACQRVFWLCDFAGEPGADTTPFTNATYNCPGDDDLEHVLGAEALVEALDSSFRIVESCLDTWTLDMLDEELRRPEWDDSWVHSRGSVLQRVFSHDVYHCGELSQTLGIAGLPQIDLWD